MRQGYCSCPVCVCVFVKSHITSGVSVCPENISPQEHLFVLKSGAVGRVHNVWQPTLACSPDPANSSLRVVS